MANTDLMFYFLGTKVWQTKSGILIIEEVCMRYLEEVCEMDSCKPILTLAEERLKLVKDSSGDLVDVTIYKRLVESL